jgi:hypothetical protein
MQYPPPLPCAVQYSAGINARNSASCSKTRKARRRKSARTEVCINMYKAHKRATSVHRRGMHDLDGVFVTPYATSIIYLRRRVSLLMGIPSLRSTYMHTRPSRRVCKLPTGGREGHATRKTTASSLQTQCKGPFASPSSSSGNFFYITRLHRVMQQRSVHPGGTLMLPSRQRQILSMHTPSPLYNLRSPKSQQTRTWHT